MKYVINDIVYCMTGNMGTGESFPCRSEVVITVNDDCVEMVENRLYVLHKDIQRYFQMSIEEYFEHEMNVYRCNQKDVEFRSLKPLNNDGYIICREITDFRDLSLIKRKWVYNKAIDETQTKVLFEKYLPAKAQDLFDLFSKDDVFFASNKTSKYNYTIYFSESGLPIKMEEKNNSITTIFKSMKILK